MEKEKAKIRSFTLNYETYFSNIIASISEAVNTLKVVRRRRIRLRRKIASSPLRQASEARILFLAMTVFEEFRNSKYIAQIDFDAVAQQSTIVSKLINGLIKKSKSFIIA